MSSSEPIKSIVSPLPKGKLKTCQPEDLRERALSGDPTVVQDVILCFQDEIMGFLRKRCGDANDAEDATQDAFESVIRYMDGYRGESSLKNWMYRLASTACTRMRRGQKNDIKRHTTLDDAAVSQLASMGQEVEAMLEAKLMPISEALHSLNETDRNVLWLRDGEGFNTEETAQELGLTATAVKSRLHRARKQLREKLEDRPVA